MACSLRVSLQGSGVQREAPHPALRTSITSSLPFPLGAGPKATGKQTALVQLSKSSTGSVRLQISCEFPGNYFRYRPDCSLQPPENSNHPARMQPPTPVESPVFCGKVLCCQAVSDRLLDGAPAPLADQLHHAIDRSVAY